MHGWGGSIVSFYAVADKLSAKCRCTLLDFYGFGDTPHPQHPLSLKDYANGVMEIIKYYRMEDVILVGHSFGGRVAILIASYSSHISGIVLCNSAGIKPRRGIKYHYKVLKYKLCRRLGIRNIRAGSTDYNKLTGAMKETFIRVVNYDLTPLLYRITVKTLIIWGDKDGETPLYMARKLNKHIPNSELRILEGAGHYSYLDNFNQFIGLLKAYIDSIPYSEV